MRLPIVLICFFLFTAAAMAQVGEDYHIQQYSTDNGMPSNGIKGLQWDDETGFLWIATEAGIARFNGLDFKNFTKDNTSFISSERMLFLVRNRQGKIYTSDQRGNILTVSRNKLLFYEKAKPAVPGYYNNLFTISVSDTLYHNKTPYRGTNPFSLLGNMILPITDSSCFILANRLYIYSASMHSAIKYGDTSLATRAGFKIDDNCFAVDRDYRIHLLHEDASRNKIIPIINEDGSPFSSYNTNTRFFWKNGAETPIIINGKNAWALRFAGDKIIASLICAEVPLDALVEYAQYSFSKKLLFLGTNSKGIFVITRKRLEPMKSKRLGIGERNAYYSQVELPSGNLLTGEGHIIGKNPQPAASPIKGKFGYFVPDNKDGLLWYSQVTAATAPNNHLNSYDYKTGKTTEYPKILGSEIIIKSLSNGRSLVVSEFGMGWFTGDSIQYIYRHPSINYDNIIYDLVEIKPGILLIAGCSGVLQFDIASKKMDTLLDANGNCFRSLWQYEDYIFLGTYGRGIYVWKNGTLKSLPLDKKKYLLYAHCFVPDEYGFCWISTNRGLFIANINELVNAAEHNNATVYYHYLGKNDGMEMLEMNGGCMPCALIMKNKTISFPTMDGLLWVNPERAKPILPDGQIFIDEIIADSIQIDAKRGRKIILPAKTKDISIKLGFSAWCNKENIYVDYQLNDTLHWRSLNTDNDAILHFSNLPEGDYTLRLRKLNGFGINNYSYETINFRIITPWHKKWWFTLLVMAALTGLIFLYVHLRTNQLKKNQLRLEKQVSEKTKELQEQNEILEKNNSIKTRLISIISHDIVTPLKFLTVAGKNLLEKKDLMSEDLQKETISEMTTTSQELQLLSTNILNWIKFQNENRRMTKETFNVHEMVNQVLGILNSLAQQKNLRIANEIPNDATIYQYYEPLKILVYNLLTNAIHFSEKGTIVLKLRTENNETVLSVADEGAGMTAEKIQSLMADHVVISSANVDNKKGHGLGFLIIKDLLKTMGASIHIDSAVGMGSTISIIIPV